MDDAIIQEQMAYYQARAQEYNESIFRVGRYALGEQEHDDVIDDLQEIAHAVQQLGSFASILELACGTGIWTKQLLTLGQSVTAIDASIEMIEANRAAVQSDRVHYQQKDLFSWKPNERYDLIFMAFWLCHMPPEVAMNFLRECVSALGQGGQIAIVDQWTQSEDDRKATDEGIYQKRKLYDGRTFRIIKVFYDPNALIQMLATYGVTATIAYRGKYCFFLHGIRQEAG